METKTTESFSSTPLLLADASAIGMGWSKPSAGASDGKVKSYLGQVLNSLTGGKIDGIERLVYFDGKRRAQLEASLNKEVASASGGRLSDWRQLLSASGREALQRQTASSNPPTNKPAPSNTPWKIGGVDVGAVAREGWNRVKNVPNPLLGGLTPNQAGQVLKGSINAGARTINQTVRAPVLPVAEPASSFESVRARADSWVARASKGKFDSVADLVHFAGDNKAANRLRGQVTQMLQKDAAAQAGGFSNWKQVLTAAERGQLERTLVETQKLPPTQPNTPKQQQAWAGQALQQVQKLPTPKSERGPLDTLRNVVGGAWDQFAGDTFKAEIEQLKKIVRDPSRLIKPIDDIKNWLESNPKGQWNNAIATWGRVFSHPPEKWAEAYKAELMKQPQTQMLREFSHKVRNDRDFQEQLAGRGLGLIAQVIVTRKVTKALQGNPGSAIQPIKQTPTAVATAGQGGLRLQAIKETLRSLGNEVTPSHVVKKLRQYMIDITDDLKTTPKGTARYKELADIRAQLDQRLNGRLKPTAVVPQPHPTGVNQPTPAIKPAPVSPTPIKSIAATPLQPLQPFAVHPSRVKLDALLEPMLKEAGLGAPSLARSDALRQFEQEVNKIGGADKLTTDKQRRELIQRAIGLPAVKTTTPTPVPVTAQQPVKVPNKPTPLFEDSRYGGPSPYIDQVPAGTVGAQRNPNRPEGGNNIPGWNSMTPEQKVQTINRLIQQPITPAQELQVRVNGQQINRAVEIGGQRFTPLDLALLARSPPGAVVNITVETMPSMTRAVFQVEHPWFNKPARSELILAKTENYLVNRHIALRAGLPSGTGGQLLLRQAMSAQNKGMSSIISDAYADGKGQFVGPYVWAVYGFDAAVPLDSLAALGLDKTKPHRISELMNNPSLRAKWKDHVVNHPIDMIMTLDLRPGSQGLQRLQAALPASTSDPTTPPAFVQRVLTLRESLLPQDADRIATGLFELTAKELEAVDWIVRRQGQFSFEEFQSSVGISKASAQNRLSSIGEKLGLDLPLALARGRHRDLPHDYQTFWRSNRSWGLTDNQVQLAFQILQDPFRSNTQLGASVKPPLGESATATEISRLQNQLLGPNTQKDSHQSRRVALFDVLGTGARNPALAPLTSQQLAERFASHRFSHLQYFLLETISTYPLFSDAELLALAQERGRYVTKQTISVAISNLYKTLGLAEQQAQGSRVSSGRLALFDLIHGTGASSTTKTSHEASATSGLQSLQKLPQFADALRSDPHLYNDLKRWEEQGWRLETAPGKEVDGLYPQRKVIVVTSGTDSKGQPMAPADIHFSLRQSIKGVERMAGLYERVMGASDLQASIKPRPLTMVPSMRHRDQVQKTPYLNDAERLSYRVELKNGRLIRADGNALDTSGMHTQVGKGMGMFVVTSDGEFYVANGLQILPGRGVLKESSLSSGEPVLYAGVLGTDAQGRITTLSDYSEAYEPRLQHTEAFLIWLRSQGVPLNDINFARIYGTR
ncbi:MAG: hypothetical protein HEQ39_04130 [Rhizobacter sp.]